MIMHLIAHIPVVIHPNLHLLATEALSGYFHQYTSHPEKEASLASPLICVLEGIVRREENDEGPTNS